MHYLSPHLLFLSFFLISKIFSISFTKHMWCFVFFKKISNGKDQISVTILPIIFNVSKTKCLQDGTNCLKETLSPKKFKRHMRIPVSPAKSTIMSSIQAGLNKAFLYFTLFFGWSSFWTSEEPFHRSKVSFILGRCTTWCFSDKEK